MIRYAVLPTQSEGGCEQDQLDWGGFGLSFAISLFEGKRAWRKEPVFFARTTAWLVGFLDENGRTFGTAPFSLPPSDSLVRLARSLDSVRLARAQTEGLQFSAPVLDSAEALIFCQSR